MKYEDDIEYLWKKIEEEKLAQNKMDFDDLINHAATLLKESDFTPKWIIVDEFQDCNEAQLEMIKTMAKEETKLFVVGDPNQIIYTWRGSDEKVFEKFKLYFSAKERTLPINYRSSATILDAAKAFLSSESQLEGIRNQGKKIKVKKHYNPFNEAQYLADEIKSLVQYGYNYKDIAILYRTQRQADIIEETLRRNQIPTEVSVKKTLKDIPVLRWLVYVLKGAVNENDENNIISALRNDQFGEGLTLSQIKRLLKGDDCISSKLYEKIVQFKTWAKGKTLEHVAEIHFYFELDDYISPTSIYYDEDREVIDEFFQKVTEYLEEKSLPLFDGILEFVNLSALYGLNIFEETTNLEQNSVKLMTLHACKGLEFKKVFIIGVNNGLVPLRTRNREEYEEEKRLFFVGITRAKDELEISYYTAPDEYWVPGGPSPFISMLPNHLIEQDETERREELDMRELAKEIVRRRKQGSTATELLQETAIQTEEKVTVQVVRHKKYGEGVVVEEDDASITVEFQGYGKKTFSKLFVQLEYLG